MAKVYGFHGVEEGVRGVMKVEVAGTSCEQNISSRERRVRR